MKQTLLGLIIWSGLASFSGAADIVALCIGNDAYLRDEDKLDTPVADATLMSETLRAIPGVREQDVILLKDGTRESIRTALRQFREKARAAKLSIVFFSGHGMEDQPTGYDRAETFLLPIDAVIETPDHLPDRAVGLGEILGVFHGLGPGGRVVVLDCCRTGAPSATKALAGAGKSVSEDLDARVARALGQAELSEGTLVSFSAGPGRKAAAFLKDSDAYSPFTHFLAKGIREEGGDLFGILSRATATTREATGGRQIPRVRFDGDPSLISAVPLGVSRPIVMVPPTPVSPPGNSAEMEALRAELAAEKKAREEAEARAKMVGTPTQARLPPVPSTPDPRPSTPPSAPMVRTDPAPAGGFPAASGMEGSRAGEMREFGGITMVWCPPGEFLMGSPPSEAGRRDDETQHRVTLTKGFWLAKTETTQQEWESVMGSNPSNFKGADLPVETVSWDDVQGWMAKMNAKNPLPSGWKWSLPTEAQWEYACRAGTNGPYAGKNLAEMGWHKDNSNSGTTNPVGKKKANPWGLQDMHGNVWEWCIDWYANLAATSVVDPTGPSTKYGQVYSNGRVLKGGSWHLGVVEARSAARGRSDSRGNAVGFRSSAVPAER